MSKLRIANASIDDEDREAEREDEWPREAIMHMNLGSGSEGSRRRGDDEWVGYNGQRGYGNAL